MQYVCYMDGTDMSDGRRIRGQKARERLLRLASEYSNLSELRTGAICRKAGVTRGSLYHHFGSRDGLLIALRSDAVSSLKVALLAAAAKESGLWERLVAGASHLIHALTSERYHFLLSENQFPIEELTGPFFDSLKTLEKERELKISNCDLLAIQLLGSILESARWLGKNPLERKLKDVINTNQYLIRSLRRSSGRSST